jgi:hypothetical protein
MSVLGTQLIYEWYTIMFAIINGHQNNTYLMRLELVLAVKTWMYKTLELVCEIT